MSTPLPPPSDEEREAFRTAAIRAGRTPVPRGFLLLVAAAFVVLGGGGVLLEHVLGGSSAPPSPVTTTTAPANVHPPSPTAILGLHRLSGARAPAIALVDQNGRPWSLADARGRTVLLAFWNARCDDICPVVGTELREARALLAPRPPLIVIVNTDPRATSVVARPAALVATGLLRPGVLFLNGDLAQLNATWARYGIQVHVTSASAVPIHNDALYVIDGRGRLRDLVTPFADESRAGRFTLGAATERAFARALATLTGSVSA